MRTTVEHPGTPTVTMWHHEVGSGEPLVLLHGGAVDGRFFEGTIGPLTERFHVFVPDLRGHGHTPDAEGPFSYEAFATDTIAFLESAVGGPAHLVGHSIGAGVALLVALRRPDLVARLVLVSGAFHHDGLVTGADGIDVDQVVAAFGTAYGEVSPDGEAHYRVVIEKVAALDMNEPDLPESVLAEISPRTLVVAGDDDIVTLEHTLSLYRGIPDAELAVVPGTSHFLLQEKPTLCWQLILPFLPNDPVPTVAPVRRAPAGT
jgi:pimeloyl-ACP methyl ester carboxylesterase